MNQKEKTHIKIHMLDMVNKAITIIRRESRQIVATAKESYKPDDEDWVTNGDIKAQEMYVREITTHFPTFGIIAEEENLVVPCTDPKHDIYFTIDPLDGTKAYKRNQAHDVGTMIALVKNDKVIATYIGDINSGDIYGYAPGEEATRTHFGYTAPFLLPNLPLRKQYLLIRDHPHLYPDLIQKMVLGPDKGGLFKDLEISGGSIGTFLARLWIGEVGAIVLRPTMDTPWDLTPIVGICENLGYAFFNLNFEAGGFTTHFPYLLREKREQPYDQLIIHSKYIQELVTWEAQQRIPRRV